ncbi:MAG: hypothetical protein R2695_19705 [Acidimicrobiales bacterium]
MTVYSSAGEPADVEAYRTAGIGRVVVWLPPADDGAVFAELDRHRDRLADHLAPPS